MRWLHRLRRVHHGAAYLATGVLVLMALVGIAASQFLPWVERNPQRVAHWLSERAGRPVQFDRLQTSWTRRGPLLVLDNLRIGAGTNVVAIGDAEILVSQYEGLLPGHSFTELRVRNLDLSLERSDDGRWRVDGLPGQQTRGGDPFDALQRLGELQVIGARLHVRAPAQKIDVQIPQVHLRLKVDGHQLRTGLRAWMREGATPLTAALDFDRDNGNGRAWLASPATELVQWSPLLQVAGMRALGGSGNVQAWMQMQGHRVTAVDAQVDLRRIALASGDEAPAAGSASKSGSPQSGSRQPGSNQAGLKQLGPHRVQLPRVAGRLRWAMIADGWRLDTPELLLGEGADAPRIRKLTIAGGKQRALLVDRIDAAPLLEVAALSNRIAPGLRHWLAQTRPQATLRDVRLTATRDAGVQHVQGRVEAVGFRASGRAPGVSGLSGEVIGDADGVAFRFDPKSEVAFDWPWGFGVPHRVRLQGSIAGWRDGNGWRTGTPALAIRGSDYSADLRGELWFQGDGSRPRIDVAADVGPAPVVAAKRFWMRNSMPRPAVHWLDNALQGGTVRKGHAVLSGDLDDWPFRNHQGVFLATARVEDAEVKFQPEWPAAQRLNADVDFTAQGFHVRGERLTISGIDVADFDAGIAQYSATPLRVNAQAQADASQLLGLLRDSPLQKVHGETLTNIDASGAAQVQYALELPPLKGAAPIMRGEIALQDARLVEKRWDLAFDEVSGNAIYGSGGFDAQALSVVHEGRPAHLSLRAGDAFVRTASHAFEGELEARLSASELLRRAPKMSWLQPKISGVSPWSIEVAIPRAAAASATPSRLRLRSDLVGTALLLPAPMDKPSATALATTVDVDLPVGQGEIAVAFGNRLALRARAGDAATGMRVVFGSNRVEAPPPASGLVVSGRAARLDAIDWATLTRSDDAGEGGLALRSADVTASALQLIGGSFPNMRLRASPSAAGTAIRLDGAALSGALVLPKSSKATISGQIARLHWQSSKSVTTAALTRSSATSAPATNTLVVGAGPVAEDPVDPSKVPPLDLTVADLRFGGAQLGQARFRTRPTVTGMQITQLQTRAPGQSIDITGDWNRTADGMQTRLDARLQSKDFGALLGGFGVGSQVSKGQGRAHLQAHWPGSPAAMRLAELSGSLRLDARDGQLVQVEPGAGRVLGLLSIAQLPRRLTLDFRDLFDKGLAFDTLSGDIRFGGGSARSDHMVIDGPAAEIHIRGAADLRTQTYDQTIDVFPRTGNLLTVAGAIAGGPVGAAIGAAANAVLKKPLGQLTAKTYRVTGPWKAPKVETVGRQQAEAEPEPAAEPPG